MNCQVCADSAAKHSQGEVAPKESRAIASTQGRIGQGRIGITAGVLLFIALAIFAFIARDEVNLVTSLDSANATFTRDNQSSANVRPNIRQLQWLSEFIFPYWNDIDSVTFHSESLQDEDLAFLRKLPNVKSLQLHSDGATDKTLETICTLENLRSLSITGEKFTVHGLLRLRKAGKLEQLRIDTDRYSPIEMAVLKSELMAVNVSGIELPKRRIEPLALAVF